jgi:TPR repeat protein
MRHIFFFLLIVMLSPISWGADLGKGMGAYQKGDYATALREWTPFAEQGYADAQYNLGWMYANGEGVIKDDVYSHMWLNIASSNGDQKAGEYRDSLAKKLTPQQLERAQQLARECVAKDYKGC